ncbi:type III pantothenate kinase [Actinomycetospora straminea]|uniref:Type III pantothenate kinase n=1 Tax=Actinomycetospora straminea TaxID=663607 RepID=A0ABP9E825_9PSEU|nr:type III pantothenate kinase [Actinomycetospora straminea]MDD7931876.1 type III pantothenate kinase [Actinomycetospora straminea]
MLLCVDVGNTQTALALYPPEGPAVWDARLRTEPRATGDEIALLVRGLLGARVGDVSAVAALSTVPALMRELRGMVARHFAGLDHLLVEPGVRTGVPLLVDNPKEVGADRVVQALAVFERHGGPCVVVTFGTSTTVDGVSARGEFLGGAIAAGVAVSAEALAVRAAALRPVELVVPRSVLGRNTVESMQAGLVLGAAAQVDGLVARVGREITARDPEGRAPVAVVASGGLAPVVVDECATITDHVPDLTLLGLRTVHRRWQERRDDRAAKRAARS